MPERPSRDDNETTSTRCPVCASTFTPIRRQRYCTNACRQVAYRRRHHTLGIVQDPPAGSRRHSTIYECGNCEQRYHGQQWCEDCNRPCRRVGIGGRCPHCDEPAAIKDLLDST